LFDDLVWRGLVHDVTDPALGDLLGAGPLTAYHGIEPTADSLAVHHLLGIIGMIRLQQAGHRVLALVGGGTAMVGDPSGSSGERSLLDLEEVKANVEGVRSQMERLLEQAGGPTPVRVIDNSEWLWPLGLMEFLRDIGKHFTVNAMLAKESVRARLEEREQGISFTEFSYMLLQAYDFLHLFDTHGCRLQLGGSDQWGNIVMGADLVRRVRGEQVFGLTTPLLVDEHGGKLGKTEAGAVWLDAARTSPYRLYQYLLNTADTQVGTLLRAFTLLPRERIEGLDAATAEHPERREGQRALAQAVVSLVHGAAEAERAAHAGAVLFSEDIAGLDEATLLDVVAEAPVTTMPRSSLADAGLSLIDALQATEMTPSKSAARRAIDQGGAYVNNRRIADVDQALTVADLLHDRYVILRKGKRDHHLLRFEA
ncbi:MAG TPA: tyrosine--tRNA ligase, partial [Acidimicrobiales bacterium]|nr:tyrosine--tRNA ligase [Acidimicrobiales bacterium]